MKTLRGCVWMLVGLGLVLPLAATAAQPNAKKSGQRVIVYLDADDSVETLKARGLKNIENYGTYVVAEVEPSQVGDLQRTHGARVEKADHLNQIKFRTATIDTTVGEPAVADRLRDRAPGNGMRLRLVQFKGPIRSQWIDELKKAGNVRVLHYLPHNAYLVRMDARAEGALQDQLVSAGGAIQWIGAYHPQYKLHPKLVGAQPAEVEVYLAVADSADADQVLAGIRRFVIREVEQPVRARNQITWRVAMLGVDVANVAQIPDVLWIDPVKPTKRMDYVQDLVIATGENNITPTDYLDYLTNQLGFPYGPSAYPVVDIADSGLDRGNPVNGNQLTAPWFPIFYQYGGTVDSDAMCGALPNAFNPSRVVYNDAADTDGHGTIVAGIVSGYEPQSQPDEVLSCFVEVRSRRCVTNITVVFTCVTNSFTVDCNSLTCPTYPPQCCTNFIFTCSFVTNTTEVCSNVCEVVQDNASSISPPWCLPRGGLGLGVNPLGRIGASLGGAEGGFPGPYSHAEEIYLRTARLSNNSWGEVLEVGVNDGEYDALSQAYDIVTRDALATGSTNPPTPGTSPVNQELAYIFAGGNANGVDGVGGFGDVLITPPATAKNVISVGASDLTSPGNLAPFTSFGPTKDGRTKPDVVAPGIGIAGAVSQASYTHPRCGGCSPNAPFPAPCTEGFTLYDIFTRTYLDRAFPQYDPPFGCSATGYGGTSFAAPAVTGAAQLLWWWFQNRFLMLQPSPAMMRAYICNSALYLPITNPLTGAIDKLPSPAQGWGRLDLSRMFDGVPRVVRDQSPARAIDSPLLSTNPVVQQTYFTENAQSYEVTYQVADATKPLRVTLAWSDAPGTPNVAGPQLVNNLDLEVSQGTKLYKGNVFDRNTSKVAGSLPPDNLNNLESVILPAGQTGTWTVVVRASNIVGIGVPNVSQANNQDFALVVYNAVNSSDAANVLTNDSCQSAATITSYPYVWTNTLSQGLYHNNHPSPTAGRGGVEEFFKIEFPTVGTVFSANTFGSSFNTILSVWKGECGALEEVVSNDNASNSLQSALSWTVTDTNDYYIVLEGRGNATGTAVLNVRATPPPFSFETSVLDFGSVYVSESTNRTSRITNGTGGSVIVAGVSIVGSNAADFELLSEDCTGRQIVNGNSCEFIVRFAPTAAGLRTAQLQIDDNVTGSPHILPLTGIGLAQIPIVCQTRTSLDFGAWPVGLTSTVSSVTLTNCGTAPLFITNAFITGLAAADYQIVSNDCSGSSIPVNAACTLAVVFTPSTTGVRSAMVNITDDASGSPHTFTLSGSGTPRAPVVCFSNNAVAFGNIPLGTSSAVTSILVSNCGSAALSISAVTLTGAGAAQFAIVSQDCTGGSIPAGGTCSIGVQFTPTEIGSASATVSLTDNASGSPHTVALTGNGTGSQPDGWISAKRKPGKAVGDNVFNGTGDNQTIIQKLKRGKARAYYVQCQNDGNATDNFLVRGSEDSPGQYTVRYFLGAIPGEDLDVTAAVKAGTFATANLAGGAVTGDATLLRVELTATTNAVAGTYSALITFTSSTNLAKTDTVRASGTVK